MEPIYDFNFVKDLQTRAFLVSAFNAVSECELWPWFKCFDSSNSFMFSTGPEMTKFQTVLFKDPINNYHSGTSYGCVLREIEYIAKNGYEKYKTEHENQVMQETLCLIMKEGEKEFVKENKRQMTYSDLRRLYG